MGAGAADAGTAAAAATAVPAGDAVPPTTESAGGQPVLQGLRVFLFPPPSSGPLNGSTEGTYVYVCTVAKLKLSYCIISYSSANTVPRTHHIIPYDIIEKA